jgi:hypothetical protein
MTYISDDLDTIQVSERGFPAPINLQSLNNVRSLYVQADGDYSDSGLLKTISQFPSLEVIFLPLFWYHGEIKSDTYEVKIIPNVPREPSERYGIMMVLEDYKMTRPTFKIPALRFVHKALLRCPEHEWPGAIACYEQAQLEEHARGTNI